MIYIIFFNFFLSRAIMIERERQKQKKKLRKESK
jgi:hypothetical protein